MVHKKKTIKKTRSRGKRPIQIGYYDLPAYKSPSEDRISSPLLSEHNALVAIFDGHGGHEVVERLYTELPKRIKQNIGSSQDPESIATTMIQEFEKMDAELAHYSSGSTAIVAVILQDYIIIANVGDSPAMLITKGGALLAVTENHDCYNRKEQERVKTQGGICIPDLLGYLRLRSGLAVTRSFGDFKHDKNIVIGSPQTYIWKRTPDTILAIMSDSFAEKIVTNEIGQRRIASELKSEDIMKELLTSLKEHKFNVEAAAKKAVVNRVSKMENAGDNTSLLFVYL